MAQNSIRKIAVIGAESTGKSWLCETLAKHYRSVWVREYAREYFHDSDIYNYTLNDLLIIAREQLRQESLEIKNANRFLFCDTTLITLKIWAELEFKTTPPFIEERLRSTHYDHYFITDNQVPWEEDALRQNKFSRDLILEMNVAEVKKLGADYTLITGLEDERLQQAVRSLDELFSDDSKG